MYTVKRTGLLDISLYRVRHEAADFSGKYTYIWPFYVRVHTNYQIHFIA